MKQKMRILIGLFLVLTICISNGAVFAQDGGTEESPEETQPPSEQTAGETCEGFTCTQPEAQDDWEDGDTITAQMYFENYSINPDGATMEDESDAGNTQYEVECADPNTTIYVGTSSSSPVEHQLTITSPESPEIQALFDEDAIYDVRVGVNVSEEQSWDDEMEKYVYWSLLGYNVSLTTEQQTKVDLVRSGVKDTILRQIDILFLMPENPATKQLTFIQICAEKIGGCTDPSAANYNAGANYDDGTCFYVVNGCMDPSAENFDPAANTDDGSCQYIDGCTDPAATNYNGQATRNDGSCRYETTTTVTVTSYSPPPATNTSLLIPVTGVDQRATQQQWMVQGLVLLVGITFVVSGLRKQD